MPKVTLKINFDHINGDLSIDLESALKELQEQINYEFREQVMNSLKQHPIWKKAVRESTERIANVTGQTN